MRKLNNIQKKVVSAWLAGLAKQNHGKLTPEMVKLDATDPDSPGHPFFTWDDAQAADDRRTDEARVLIRWAGLKVVDEIIKREIHYVRDPDAGDEQGYVAVTKLKTNRAKSIEALKYEITRAVGYLERARVVAYELDIEDRFDDLLAEIQEVRATL